MISRSGTKTRAKKGRNAHTYYGRVSLRPAVTRSPRSSTTLGMWLFASSISRWRRREEAGEGGVGVSSLSLRPVYHCLCMPDYARGLIDPADLQRLYSTKEGNMTRKPSRVALCSRYIDY